MQNEQNRSKKIMAAALFAAFIVFFVAIPLIVIGKIDTPMLVFGLFFILNAIVAYAAWPKLNRKQ